MSRGTYPRVLTGGVLSTDDFQLEVLAIAHSGDVLGLDIEDFLDTKTTIAHQPDSYLLFERLGFPREHLVFAPREPDVPGAVFVPLSSHCVLLMSIMHLSVLVSTLNRGYSRHRAEYLHVIVQTCRVGNQQTALERLIKEERILLNKNHRRNEPLVRNSKVWNLVFQIFPIFFFIDFRVVWFDK